MYQCPSTVFFLFRLLWKILLLYTPSETPSSCTDRRSWKVDSNAAAWLKRGITLFLHDRPWISPWIKSISNELDIIIHMTASQLSGHCDVISNRLWRHQQNENWASETRGRCVNIVVFIVIIGFVMSCKKWNDVCTLVMNRFYAHSSVILVFISLVASQLGKLTPE